jgi:DNA ligase (NAD+)
MNRGHTENLSAIRGQLLRANEAYHLHDSPIMPDDEYDALLRRYREAGGEVDWVGGRPSAAFAPVNHEVPLMSLQDIFSEEELHTFLTAGIEYCIEPKIDGLSVSLRYENGRLAQAATRGDGTTGEDVTHNALVVNNIPKTLSIAPNRLIVRGEVYMPRGTFARLNRERDEAGLPHFANPRNAAAGSFRQKDSAVTAERGLSFIAFNIQLMEGVPFPQKHHETLDLLENWGFSANKYTLADTHEAIAREIEKIGAERASYPFDTDGAVIKVNDLALRRELGETSRAPRWAAAYKYPAERKETVVLGIEIQVGRTGVLTPRATLEPVSLSGSTVRYATLHNRDFIAEKDICVGDTVSVQKAGEIIPEIVSVNLEKRPPDAVPYEFPDVCPRCSVPLPPITAEAAGRREVAVRCLNDGCPAQLVRRLIHFASRDAMDIEGMGVSTVESLCKANMVDTIDGLYRLTLEDFLTLDGFAEKSAKNLLEAIEKSKGRGLARLVFGLGIRHVGQKAALTLAQTFGSIENLISATEEELSKVQDIGPVIAGSLSSYLETEQALIAALRECGVDMTCEVKAAGGEWEGLTFVLTGALESMTREQAGAEILKRGGRASGSVSQKTSYVIAGEKAGSKLDKAQSLGVKVITEQEFLDMLGI